MEEGRVQVGLKEGQVGGREWAGLEEERNNIGKKERGEREKRGRKGTEWTVLEDRDSRRRKGDKKWMIYTRKEVAAREGRKKEHGMRQPEAVKRCRVSEEAERDSSICRAREERKQQEETDVRKQ